jgi:alpha-L-rhamnosidase
MEWNKARAAALPSAERFEIARLFCGKAEDPVAANSLAPLFSWQAAHPGRGCFQTAYRIAVASTLCNLEAGRFDVWDTGKARGGQCTGVPYAGPRLQSGAEYWWKLALWDDGDARSPWSRAARFGVGLLRPEDWQAAWVGYPSRNIFPVMLRGVLPLAEKPVRAVVYACGLGYGALSLNGRAASPDVLGPPWTDFSKQVQYDAYDITDRLEIGENVFGVMLAKGRYCVSTADWAMKPYMAILQANLFYADGRKECFSTAQREAWRVCAEGPVIESSIYDGEVYDARREMPGWDAAGFAPGGAWVKPIIVNGPGGVLVPRAMEGIRVVEEIRPACVASPAPGVYVYDLGQNMVGWIRMRLRGNSGDEATFKFAELRYADGTVNMENLKTARCTDRYILKGGGEELYQQRFTHHGFRYVQVECGALRPELGDLAGLFLMTAAPQAGWFECSSALLNRIHAMVCRTEAANLFGVPTDCPQRDERLGWLNDLTVRIEESLYNFNLSRFYEKFAQDIADTQGDMGAIADTAPYYPFGRNPACPVSSSYLLLPWLLYLHYGDSQTMARHYQGMRRWDEYLHLNSAGGLVEYSSYGDWASPASESVDGSMGAGAMSATTPGALMSTGYHYLNCVLLSKMARALGMREEADFQRRRAAQVREAFNRAFFRPAEARYAGGSQASYAFPLWLGVVPPECRARAVQGLVDSVTARDWHLATGNQCTKYLIEVLTREGHADIACRLMSQTTYPSLGYMLENGATTVWERWERVETGPMCGMASHNHPMHGAADAWFYAMLAGILPCEDAPGFERVRIRPCFPKGMQWAKAVHQTVRGAIVSEWRRDGDGTELTVALPFNCAGEVALSPHSGVTVLESGRTVWENGFLDRGGGIRGISVQNGALVAAVGSGEYRFRVEARARQDGPE